MSIFNVFCNLRNSGAVTLFYLALHIRIYIFLVMFIAFCLSFLSVCMSDLLFYYCDCAPKPPQPPENPCPPGYDPMTNPITGEVLVNPKTGNVLCKTNEYALAIRTIRDVVEISTNNSLPSSQAGVPTTSSASSSSSAPTNG